VHPTPRSRRWRRGKQGLLAVGVGTRGRRRRWFHRLKVTQSLAQLRGVSWAGRGGPGGGAHQTPRHARARASVHLRLWVCDRRLRRVACEGSLARREGPGAGLRGRRSRPGPRGPCAEGLVQGSGRGRRGEERWWEGGSSGVMESLESSSHRRGGGSRCGEPRVRGSQQGCAWVKECWVGGGDLRKAHGWDEVANQGIGSELMCLAQLEKGRGNRARNLGYACI
jgi:hypothetical protein